MTIARSRRLFFLWTVIMSNSTAINNLRKFTEPVNAAYVFFLQCRHLHFPHKLKKMYCFNIFLSAHCTHVLWRYLVQCSYTLYVNVPYVRVQSVFECTDPAFFSREWGGWMFGPRDNCVCLGGGGGGPRPILFSVKLPCKFLKFEISRGPPILSAHGFGRLTQF